MIYKHYIIKYDKNGEYKGTATIAYTITLKQAKELDFIISTFYSLNDKYKNYKIGFTPQ